MKFSDIGIDNLKDSTTFKKIQTFSKSNPQKLYSNVDEFNLKYKKLSDLYLNDSEPINTSTYATKRQHNYSSKQALLNNSNTYLDSHGFETLINYNNSITTNVNPKGGLESTKFSNHESSINARPLSDNLQYKINTRSVNNSAFSLNNYLSFLNKTSLLLAENDTNQSVNPLKTALNTK